MSTAIETPGIGGHTYACSLYGLRVRSVVPLPAAAAPGGRAADAEIRWAELGRVTRELAVSSLPARATGGEAGLSIAGVGTFLVRHGREVLMDTVPDAGVGLLQLALLGPVLAALLQQRGHLVLHGSAVEIDGLAVGFLGGRGAGKSTMAAALLDRGHELLADDTLAISFEDGSPAVLPGLPQLKLWPDSVAALGGDAVALPRVREGHDKRARRTGGALRASASPLACLYVLSDGAAVSIEPLSSRDAFLAVVAHSYGIMWLHGVSGPAQFGARAELVRRVPVRRLRRPPALHRIAEVARLVEEDLGTW